MTFIHFSFIQFHLFDENRLFQVNVMHWYVFNNEKEAVSGYT